MVATVQKWGNSQGLRFPKALLEEVDIQLGEEVRLFVENGRIVVEPIRRIRGRFKLENLLEVTDGHYRDYAKTKLANYYGQQPGRLEEAIKLSTISPQEVGLDAAKFALFMEHLDCLSDGQRHTEVIDLANQYWVAAGQKIPFKNLLELEMNFGRAALRTTEANQRLAEQRFETIFYLASIVSSEAEAQFSLGWETNLRACWTLLEALRTQHEASDGSYRPRLIFTSSLAVFGPPYPDQIPDDFHASPRTSYGAQKAASEVMIQDYSRKGYKVDCC